MKPHTTLLVLLTLGAGLACPRTASAAFITYDLTGTWTGKLTCSILSQGAKQKSVRTPAMRITQIGLNFGVLLDFGGGQTTAYAGLANPDTKKPEQKGEAALLRCGTNNILGVAIADERARMAISTKPTKVKASFKGVSIIAGGVSPGPQHGTCKWKFTRTDTVDANVPTECPVSMMVVTGRCAMSRRSLVAALFVATALVVVGPTRDVGAGAARFDLNGTWTGTVKCKSFKEGAKTKSTRAATLKVAESGLELGLLLDFGTGTTSYTGIANPDAKKPFEKGELALVSCTTNDRVGDDFSFDEIGRMAVKAKRGELKGSLKGTTLFSRPGTLGAEAGTCKWSFKRTVDDFPTVPFTCVFGIGTP